MIQPKSPYLIAKRLVFNRVNGLKQASKQERLSEFYKYIDIYNIYDT